MPDFLEIRIRSTKRGVIEIYPDFVLYAVDTGQPVTDLMVRAGDFYAVYNEKTGYWSTKETDALIIIDRELKKYAKEYEKQNTEDKIKVLYIRNTENKMIDSWHAFVKHQLRDNYVTLDEHLTFLNDIPKKTDYVSKHLKYSIEKSPTPAWDKGISTWYDEENRHKIEWVIGAIVAGASTKLQKFLVIYGPPGTGKSSVVNMFEALFKSSEKDSDYYCVFNARSVGDRNNQFPLEPFKKSPLVGICQDGDLSSITSNEVLNSLVSHDKMSVNTKNKSMYESVFKCFLVICTNKPVEITDAQSGLLRRLIDVSPTGKTIPIDEYDQIVNQMGFELGGIAYHCREVYLENPHAYDHYSPIKMISATNDFYNFVLWNYDDFKSADETTLKLAWPRYNEYADMAHVPAKKRMSRNTCKEELKNYFKEYYERSSKGNRPYDYYKGFIWDKFLVKEEKKTEEPKPTMILNKMESLLDEMLQDCPAQYGNDEEKPKYTWDNVKTTLKKLDTSKLHYVRVPLNHIVIDFDLKGPNGEKSQERNLAEASKWPKTYAEFSKGGSGVHLHYIYTGPDPEKLSRIYDENIEIKVFTGKSSLRRKLTYCNDIPVAEISSGLPLREETPMINFDGTITEKNLRVRILRCLGKEYEKMPSTNQNIQFIKKILDDAYNSGITYDLTPLADDVYRFACGSHNHQHECVQMYLGMHFKSKVELDNVDSYENEDLIFFDVEVFSNLFVVVYKAKGKKCTKMINPSSDEILELCNYKLVGFNNRRYDNHILYARIIGYSNEELFELSKRIINGDKDAFFADAYNLSYTDIYDFSSKKQSLKKFEIELGIHHQELGLPWDQPVPEELWEKVADYCINDVEATEATFEARKADFLAREILADIAEMTVNDTTNSLTTRIIFGRDKNPPLVYTDLSEMFPGYEQIDGKNMYRGEDVGKGGYVYSTIGMYSHVITFDVASMHPHSIKELNLFGDRTARFVELMDARIAIKHKDFEAAGKMFDGKLKKYLDDPDKAKMLSGALKIAINSVYGLTSASFKNPFRDPRNVNNIVALRGALFMVNLRDEVQARGFTVVHIKTDSIKVAEPTQEIFDFIMDYGKKYGYTFEIEHKFEKICLVNNAVYIGKLADDDPENPGKWEATGAQFQQPFVFKTLFSKEPLIFEDFCETKAVSGDGQMYLDFNEGLPEGEHDYRFIGKVGQFCPMKDGCGAGVLYRKSGEKYNSVTGTKGYKWMESEIVKGQFEEFIDKNYYISQANEAIDAISKFGDYDWFVS